MTVPSFLPGRDAVLCVPIIFEDADLLVVNKPAGLVCHPTKTDEYSSLISRLRLYLGKDSHPQLVNRLDRETSGVSLVAKGPTSARHLRKLWEQRQVRKEYWAIVQGHVLQPHGLIDAPLGKDEHSPVAIKDCVRPDGAPAQTEYWVQQRFERLVPDSTSSKQQQHPFTLLKIVPHAGRKHQIRIHLASLGHPLVGDKLYGKNEDFYLALVENRMTAAQWGELILPYQALHAREVRLTWRGEERLFVAEPEPWFAEFAGLGLCARKLHFARSTGP